MNREIVIEKLTARKFKNFGDVIEPKDSPMLINQNKCEYKGEVKNKVKGYSDDFHGSSVKNLIQLGKNAAVEKNGNVIIMLNYKEHRGTQSALFKIYFCR